MEDKSGAVKIQYKTNDGVMQPYETMSQETKAALLPS